AYLLESPSRQAFPLCSLRGSADVLPGLGAAIAPAMELMAVPKKKISKYKRGLRNGPRALKPVPVIVRCRCCGRVKLPHFYCCSGEKGNAGDSSS
uniref:Large ribosomal subunit protein bL32m n=1 Tax=Aegilops tauschii subsp. strangulata TaxID=200361 RepID=A0A453IVK0_AEGTS